MTFLFVLLVAASVMLFATGLYVSRRSSERVPVRVRAVRVNRRR